MAALLLIPALVFAILVLRGWPAEWAVWLRALVALAFLTGGFIAMARLSPAPQMPRFQNARRPGAMDRVMAAGAMALGLIMLYFLLVLGPTATRQVSHFLLESGESRLDESEDEEEDWNRAGLGRNGAVVEYVAHSKVGTVFDPEGAPIPSSVNLTPSDKPEVRLELTSVDDARRLHQFGSVYITAFSHNYFDGNRWSSQGSTTSRILTTDHAGLIQLPESMSRPPDYRYTILHANLQDALNTLTTLQGAHYVRLPELIHTAPGTFLLPSLKPTITSYQYEAGSSPQRFERLITNNLPIEAGVIDPIYRAPTAHLGLRRRIQELSGKFSHDLPLDRRLVQLRDWLRNTYAYSKVVRYPSNGKCALENFLDDPEHNQTGGGICVHFASAAALMAREMGVPSRVSYGWIGGRYYEPHGQFVFRGDHAHAWTEIFLSNHGWVIFDVTPSEGLPQSLVSGPGEAPPPLEDFLQVNLDETGQESENPLLGIWGWAVGICGAGLVGLVMLSAFKLGRTQRAGPGKGFAGSAPTPGYLVLFHQACLRLGHPMPTGRTLWQHLETLRGQEITLDFADELLTYHYGVTYRNLPRNTQIEKSLSLQIRAWGHESPVSAQ